MQAGSAVHSEPFAKFPEFVHTIEEFRSSERTDIDVKNFRWIFRYGEFPVILAFEDDDRIWQCIS